jgi:hypothetical protein
MPRDFYPRPESKIVAFTGNFSARINADPERYGIPAERAAGYAVLARAFADAYFAFNTPAGDSSSNYIAKETARLAVERDTRLLVRLVRGSVDVSDAMRIELGVPPRSVRRGHVPAPDSAPHLRITGTIGNVIQLRLFDPDVARRGKPKDVKGATILQHVGDEPPADAGQWRYKGNTTRVTADVSFDAALAPGTKVWLVARWMNSRTEPGPWSPPVCARVPYAVAVPGALTRRAA